MLKGKTLRQFSTLKTIITNSPDETIKLAEKLGKKLVRGDIICLTGELGGGKTTFTKGLCRAFGIEPEEVLSPSFILIKEYKGKIPLYHFDLYRIDSLLDFERLGYEEYFFGDGISVIEWAERIKKILPEEYLWIEFKILGENKRQIKIMPYGKRYRNRF